MKANYLIIAIGLMYGLYPTISTAQNAVSINTSGNPPHASSMLDVSSTTKGVLVPRMTTAQRTSIGSPLAGLMVYDTDTQSFWHYSLSGWQKISTASTGWALSGNIGTTSDFIGTTNYASFNIKANNLPAGKIDLPYSNTFWGYKSGSSTTYGALNVGIGQEALFSMTTAYGNTAVGYTSMRNQKSGSSNSALGLGALFADTSGYNNTALGYQSLGYNLGGTNNTAVGSQSMNLNTTGYFNTATGSYSLYSNTEGFVNSALGYAALYSNTTGTNNTGIGTYSLYYNTIGNYNTSVGSFALYDNITGENNTAVGAGALTVNTASGNVAIGAATLYWNTSGNQNTAVGTNSIYENLSGNNNTALGFHSLYQNTIGFSNTALGSEALFSNRASGRNTAVGARAMRYANDQTSPLSSQNTAVGFEALLGSAIPAANTGIENTAIGDQSLYTNMSGSRNTAIGSKALLNIASGSNNTALGQGALHWAMVTDNSAVGFQAGYNSDHSVQCSYIGTMSDNDTYVNAYTNSTVLGYASIMTASNQVRIGNSVINSIGGYEPWSDLSDGRYKYDIQENVPGLDFITKLRPVTYHLDAHALADRLNEDRNDLRGGEHSRGPSPETLAARDKKASVIKTGFIAQEVEAAAREIGFDFSGVDAPQNEADLYALRYSQFVVPLVKAVQELQTEIMELKKEIEELRAKEK